MPARIVSFVVDEEQRETPVFTPFCPERFRELYEQRMPIYRAAADVTEVLLKRFYYGVWKIL